MTIFQHCLNLHALFSDKLNWSKSKQISHLNHHATDHDKDVSEDERMKVVIALQSTA